MALDKLNYHVILLNPMVNLEILYTPKLYSHQNLFLIPKPLIPKVEKFLADWITSKDNPRFTTMIANRIWKQVFGAGLIEPIDTMVDKTLASNENFEVFRKINGKRKL